MATTIFSGVQVPRASINRVTYTNSYKRRLMDRSIMKDIFNGNPENIKSYLGSGKGAEVELYIPGTVKIRKTQPDGGIIYQTMTDTTERYGIAREAYWAIKYRPEDKSFWKFDPKSTDFTNATDQMARFIEREFGADIITKVPAANRGNEAGVEFGAYQLGLDQANKAVVLYKTQNQVDAATGVQYRSTAADYLVTLADVIRENEGLSGAHVNIVIPSVVKNALKTSELKLGGIFGQRNLDLGHGERGSRAEVKFLGTMDDTIGIIENNIMFKDSVFSYTANNKTHKVYPIFATTQDAGAFIDDVVYRDDAMKDVGNWDEHYRMKQVYDWPVLFPQAMAVGFVEIAENAYAAA